MTEHCLAQASPRDPSQPKLQMLAEGALAPSPSSPNLLRPQLYREALARFSSIAGQRQSSIALVIPDYAVRMAILDFEEFPSGETERAALIRFRLRKSVPFHIEEAQVSYALQIQEPGRVELLAAAIARPILQEYEQIFSDAGFRIGLVTPSSMAAMPLFGGAEEQALSLVIKLAGSTVSVLLVRRGRLHLIRTLDLSPGDETAEGTVGQISFSDSLLSVVQQTMAYAEDQIKTRVARLLVCGTGDGADTIAGVTQREFGIPAMAVRSRFGLAQPENAGLLGLLEQYTS